MAIATKRILIVTNAPAGSTKGNRITAERWAGFLNQSGYEVRIDNHCNDDSDHQQPDVLIALHATHSANAIAAFQDADPRRPVILCLTGTDLHLDLPGHRGDDAKTKASESVRKANHIVLLEPEGQKQLPANARHKVTVILQSATPHKPKPKTNQEHFEFCVIGHLRKEKDPFLAATASLGLPAESKTRVVQIGAALSEPMRFQAEKMMQACPRYRWIGPLTYDETQSRLAASQAMILSSTTEGAPSVVSEAIVNEVPILATRIPATVGLLGNRYPGLFPVGDGAALSDLMARFENDSGFANHLQSQIKSMLPKFSPDVEKRALSDLMEKVLKTD